jgi:glycosyltransferase involved in cell wall biosynthesis
MKVPFHRIDTSGNELRNVREVLESGWLTSGERVLDFEKALAASLARAIEDLASREEESRLELGANGRRYVLEHHDFKKLSTRFIEAIQSKRDQPGIAP